MSKYLCNKVHNLDQIRRLQLQVERMEWSNKNKLFINLARPKPCQTDTKLQLASWQDRLKLSKSVWSKVIPYTWTYPLADATYTRCNAIRCNSNSTVNKKSYGWCAKVYL